MYKLTQLALSLSLAGLVLTHPATASAETHKEPTKAGAKVQQKASFLFVLRAEKGAITKTAEGYELTLHGMDTKVLYFSDRPVRKAGFITMTQFMSTWTKGKDSFQDNPPNAAIVHAALKSNEKGIAQAIPVELTNPVASNDGWIFHLKDIQGKISIGDYARVSVFVDGCPMCKEIGLMIAGEGAVVTKGC